MELQSTLDEVVKSMPEVNPDVDNMPQIQIPADQPALQPAQITDRNGIAFDPALHENDNGQPRMTVDGFCKLKRGRGAQIKLNIPADVAGSQPIVNLDPAAAASGDPAAASGDPAAASGDLQTRAAAETTVLCFYQVGILIFGNEWQPDQDEHKNLCDVLTDYYKKKGITDLPAGVVVALAFGGYALKRFQQPETLSKLQKMIAWAKVKLVNLWYWFKHKKQTQAAKPAESRASNEINS